jgi:hypothetical protein
LAVTNVLAYYAQKSFIALAKIKPLIISFNLKTEKLTKIWNRLYKICFCVIYNGIGATYAFSASIRFKCYQCVLSHFLKKCGLRHWPIVMSKFSAIISSWFTLQQLSL